MQIKTLTEKGIQKMIRLESNIVLQITNSLKGSVESKSIKLTLSDGFTQHDAYISKDTISTIPGLENSDLIYLVVKILSLRTVEVKENSLIVIGQLDVINYQINIPIGNPIPYDQYKKKGNKQGSNFIPYKKPRQSSNSRTKNEKAETKVEQQIKKRSVSKQIQKKGVVRKEESLPKKPTKSIEPINKKLSPQRSQPVSFFPINELMAEATGWTILARIINKSEPRNFVGKKGPSQIMSIQLIDKGKVCIPGKFFGDAVTKFADSLELNQVYEISNGNVEMQKQGGRPSNSIQIVFSDKSIFKIHSGKERDNVPELDDIAIKISELIQKPADKNGGWDIIGLVKEERQMEMGKTKLGKNMPRKTIIVCDPDEKIQIPITLFFKLAEESYGDTPYFFKGVGVGEYQGKKQFSMSFKSNIYVVPGIKFRNRKKLQELNFTKGVEDSGNSSRSLSNLQKLIDDEANVRQDAPGWHEVRCFVNVIKTNGTLWYMGCPICKKKTTSQGPFTCLKCSNSHFKPKFYYIINIQVSDSYKSLWVTAYNEVAEVLLDGLIADDAKNLELDELREYAKCVRNKQIRILILSKGETYEGSFKVRNTISKLIPINYAQQAKDALKLIKQYEYQ